MTKILLLSGGPGTGKTTTIREALVSVKASIGGFYTEEIRVGGIRRGFQLTTLDGTKAVFAHIDNPNPHRVGKYGVDTDNLDNIGVAAVRQAIERKAVIVIDEIGKMELFSPNFKDVVYQAMKSGKYVLGTIMQSSNPFTDKIKHDRNVTIIQVTRDNRGHVLREVTTWLESITDGNSSSTGQ